ncbi:hypothetical protein ABTY53_30380 [Streptomyces noursei]|uniref:hypothetical protein n=1 Tax=Streptomyces noursei TaxID=1971 RepID=UPI003331D051
MRSGKPLLANDTSLTSSGVELCHSLRQERRQKAYPEVSDAHAGLSPVIRALQ